MKMFLIGRDYDWIMNNQIKLSDLTYWLLFKAGTSMFDYWYVFYMHE